MTGLFGVRLSIPSLTDNNANHRLIEVPIYKTNNQLQSMQMTLFVLLPSILLSGFMFPYDGMPEVAQYIAEALPATHYMRLIRGVVLRDVEIFDMTFDVYWLIIFTLLGLAVATLRFKKNLD